MVLIIYLYIGQPINQSIQFPYTNVRRQFIKKKIGIKNKLRWVVIGVGTISLSTYLSKAWWFSGHSHIDTLIEGNKIIGKLLSKAHF